MRSHDGENNGSVAPERMVATVTGGRPGRRRLVSAAGRMTVLRLLFGLLFGGGKRRRRRSQTVSYARFGWKAGRMLGGGS